MISFCVSVVSSQFQKLRTWKTNSRIAFLNRTKYYLKFTIAYVIFRFWNTFIFKICVFLLFSLALRSLRIFLLNFVFISFQNVKIENERNEMSLYWNIESSNSFKRKERYLKIHISKCSTQLIQRRNENNW